MSLTHYAVFLNCFRILLIVFCMCLHIIRTHVIDFVYLCIYIYMNTYNTMVEILNDRTIYAYTTQWLKLLYIYISGFNHINFINNINTCINKSINHIVNLFGGDTALPWWLLPQGVAGWHANTTHRSGLCIGSAHLMNLLEI